MKKSKKIYHVIFRPEPEDGYTVIVPSLPGCISYGKTLEEAEKMAEEAIEFYLETVNDCICDDSKNFIKTYTYA